MMDEEERQDTQMRERFTTKWTPKPSAELTVQLRQEADKYRGIMENAVRADAVVREKYNAHRRNMDLLSKGEVRKNNYSLRSGGKGVAKPSRNPFELKSVNIALETKSPHS